MLSRSLLLFSLLVAACGGSADLSSESADPKGAAPPNQGNPAAGNGNETKAPSQTTPATATREVKVTLRNTTKGEVRLVKDYQAPLWLEIGNPAYQLNGYGHDWCGAKEYGHNEPVFLEQKIAPGASIDVKWSGLSVAFDENASCWKYESVPSGSLPARACIYEGDDTPGGFAKTGEGNPFPAGPGVKGAPSTWFKNAPTRCVSFTIELKDGGSTVDVVIAPP